MHRSHTFSTVRLVLLWGIGTFVSWNAYAQHQQKYVNASTKLSGFRQHLESIPREEAEEVAFFGVIASIRHGDAEALSSFMQFIPERSKHEVGVLRLIGRALNRDLLNAVRSRYVKVYGNELRRYYAQADAANGELLDALTPQISCELTTTLAAAAIAADNAGHKANTGKIARRAWDCWNSCTPADQRRFTGIVDLASACARAEMWEQTQALLDAEDRDDPLEFPMVVRTIARQQLRTDRFNDAVATVASHLSRHEAKYLHIEFVDELIQSGKLERAIEYSHIQGVEGVNEVIANELARTGRIDEASELLGKMTALHKMSWRVMSAGDFLKKGMKTKASETLAAVLSDLEAIQRPVTAGDATQISGIYLQALPYLLELDNTEATHRVLEALPEYVELGYIVSSPIQARVSVPTEMYAKTAVVLSEHGRGVGADLFFRKAWPQDKHSYFSRQLLVVTMATAGRFSVCRDLVNEFRDRNHWLLAAYCEGYWKRRADQKKASVDSALPEPRKTDLALELCQLLGSISGEKSDTFEFPGWVRGAEKWVVKDMLEQ